MWQGKPELGYASTNQQKDSDLSCDALCVNYLAFVVQRHHTLTAFGRRNARERLCVLCLLMPHTCRDERWHRKSCCMIYVQQLSGWVHAATSSDQPLWLILSNVRVSMTAGNRSICLQVQMFLLVHHILTCLLRMKRRMSDCNALQRLQLGREEV
jgi:hypothetical protein